MPLKDVATALNLSMQKTGRGYELTESGGANQVEGITGKVGDVLYNGFVRFQVLKVTRTKSYTKKFTGTGDEATPIQPNNELAIVLCRMKNATQKTGTASITGGLTDALTDTEGHSYEPRRTSDIPPNQELLPGAAIDFALIFDVPPSAKLQDLVYEAQLIGLVGPEKKKFRVAVGDQN